MGARTRGMGEAGGAGLASRRWPSGQIASSFRQAGPPGAGTERESAGAGRQTPSLAAATGFHPARTCVGAVWWLRRAVQSSTFRVTAPCDGTADQGTLQRLNRGRAGRCRSRVRGGGRGMRCQLSHWSGTGKHRTHADPQTQSSPSLAGRERVPAVAHTPCPVRLSTRHAHDGCMPLLEATRDVLQCRARGTPPRAVSRSPLPPPPPPRPHTHASTPASSPSFTSDPPLAVSRPG